jgi:hypothetical protein
MKSQGKQNDSPQRFAAVWARKTMNASCSSFSTWPGPGLGRSRRVLILINDRSGRRGEDDDLA